MGGPGTPPCWRGGALYGTELGSVTLKRIGFFCFPIKHSTQWKKEQDPPGLSKSGKLHLCPPVASHAAPGVVEILELACNASRDNKKSHIIQLHVRLAVRIDERHKVTSSSTREA